GERDRRLVERTQVLSLAALAEQCLQEGQDRRSTCAHSAFPDIAAPVLACKAAAGARPRSANISRSVFEMIACSLRAAPHLFGAMLASALALGGCTRVVTHQGFVLEDTLVNAIQ